MWWYDSMMHFNVIRSNNLWMNESIEMDWRSIEPTIICEKKMCIKKFHSAQERPFEWIFLLIIFNSYLKEHLLPSFSTVTMFFIMFSFYYFHYCALFRDFTFFSCLNWLVISNSCFYLPFTMCEWEEKKFYGPWNNVCTVSARS